MPERDGTMTPFGQMLLNELQEQGRSLKAVCEDMREVKTDLKHLKDGQDDLAKRLTKLEETTSRTFPLDPKTILKIGALLATVALAASHGLPAEAWQAIIRLLGGG